MGKNVLFIGDSCIDIDHYGHTLRVSPETNKLNIFSEIQKKKNRGMVFNTYENFKNIELKRRVGHEAHIYTNDKMDCPIKHRFYDEYQKMIFRYDENDKIQFGAFKKEMLNLEGIEFVVVSDYDKGFLSYDAIEYIGERCNSQNIKCLIDTKKILTSGFGNFNFIKLNELEFKKNAKIIEEYNFLPKIICTMGEKGCVYKNIKYPTPYNTPKLVYPEGCGDTFVAGFVYEYLNIFNVVSALKYGMSMAGQVVCKKGVALPF